MDRFIGGELMRKVAALLLIVLFINFLPLYPIAENPQPDITVNGNQVEVKLDKEERATIVITDGDNNRRYIDESHTGTFKTNLSRGKYTAEVLGCEPVEFTIDTDVKVQGNAVTIAGNIEKNTYITIVVEDDKGNRVYIDQGKSDKDGEYAFNFSLKEAGEYTAYITPKEGDTQEISFVTTGEDIVDSEYILSPKNNSKENEHNTEFSIEFPYDVTLKDPLKDVQLTLKGKKIEGTPEGVNEEEYTKTFKDVLIVDSKNPKKIVVDLSRDGERLDVDYEYTVTLNDEVILRDGKSVGLLDLEWKFDTKWKYSDFLSSFRVETESFTKELSRRNGFKGIYADDSYTIKSKVIEESIQDQRVEYNYPIEWESIYPEIATVDRNGKVTGHSSGTAVIKAYVPNSDHKYAIKYINLEIKENTPRKFQVLGKYSAEPQDSISRFVVSEDGTIYLSESRKGQGAFIIALNPDTLEEREDFRVPGDGDLDQIYKVNGREYLKISKYKYPIDTSRFIDIETGETYREGIETRKSEFIQYREDSPLFIYEKERGKLALYDLETRRELWTYNYTSARADFYVNHGIIYVVFDKYITALDSDGNELWRYSNDKSILGCGVDSQGIVYARESRKEDGIDKWFLLAVQDGKLKWKSEGFGEITNLLHEEDDGVIFAMRELYDEKGNIHTGNTFFKMVKLNREDGSTIEEFKDYYLEDYIVRISGEINFFGEYTEDGETLLYTNTLVYDKDRDILAYTDIPFGKDEVLESKERDIKFKNGYLYRLVTENYYNGDRGKYTYYIEKLKLVPEYTPEPNSILAHDIDVYEDTEYTLSAKLLDQYGFIIPGKLKYELVGDIDNAINLTDDGKLKVGKLENLPEGVYSKTFTVNVSYGDIQEIMEIKVKQTPYPVAIYSVGNSNNFSNRIEDHEIVENMLIDTSNQEKAITVFVVDQHGEFLGDYHIDYSSSDDDIAAVTRQYKGPSWEDKYKYSGMLSGKKPGEAIITVSLRDNPDIKTSVTVEVVDTRYEKLWQVETTGPWGYKSSWHDSGIYDDFIYVNENHVIALDNRTGAKLWESNVGVHYGMELVHPIVDKGGIVYVYNRLSTAVAAIDSGNQGEKLWGKFYGSEPIYQMDITDNYIYLMTDNGTLYKIDKDGEKIWDKRVSDENTKDMEVYSDDIIYIVSGRDVYRIDGNGDKELVYKADGKVDIRDISENEDILLEVSSNGLEYKAICIDRDGKEKWAKDIDAEFTAQWDDDRVYILAYRSKTFSFKIYAFDRDGNQIFDPVEYRTSSIDSNGKSFTKERRPVIKNNTIYTYIRETIAFDADTGKFKWQVYIGDMYTPSAPRTLTVDDDGVVYSASGAGGQFAFVVGEKAATGFSVDLNGRPSLSLDALNNISMTVRNKTEENMEGVVLSVELYNLDTEKSTTAWAIKRGFATGVSKDYSFGIDVPEIGRYKLIIKAVQGGKVLDTLELKIVEN